MRKKVLVTAGPIPSKVDSVKYITNRFKGRLSLLVAERLFDDFDVEMVKWRGTDLKTKEPFPIHDIEDVYDYYEFVKNFKADAYVLSGAVANLAPVNPWKGKFPSHNYKEGDVFDIPFTIAPRIIDRVKEWHPRSTLIGYKLFDGSEEELLDAGWETLAHSRSNVVFANHPAKAKSEKIALMPDGTHIRMSFDEHIEFIKRIINLSWYRTDLTSLECPQNDELGFFLKQIAVEKHGYSFGTVACRVNNGFITTTRGKRENGVCLVSHVDHERQVVHSTQKATLNAPVLDALFFRFEWAKWVLHGHRNIVGYSVLPYSFSGTTEETRLVRECHPIFNVENHGYYACFGTDEAVMHFLERTYVY